MLVSGQERKEGRGEKKKKGQYAKNKEAKCLGLRLLPSSPSLRALPLPAPQPIKSRCEYLTHVAAPE